MNALSALRNLKIAVVGNPINMLERNTNPKEIISGNAARYIDPKMSRCPVSGEMRLPTASGTVTTMGNAAPAIVPAKTDFANFHMGNSSPTYSNCARSACRVALLVCLWLFQRADREFILANIDPKFVA